MNLCKFIFKIIARNLMLSGLIILIAITSYPKIPDFSSIHWQVIALLFDLMVVVAALHHYHILEWIGVKLLSRCNSLRMVTLVLTLLTTISSMFLTNDIALITFVPLTMIFALRAKFNPVRLIVIETIAANLGSSLTPLGNPQNLFLYNYFKFTLLGFLSLTSILFVIAILFIGVLIYSTPNVKLNANLDYPNLGSKRKIMIFGGLLLLILLNIAHLVDYRLVTFIVVVVSLIITPRVLLKIDYGLLLTFIAFFILVAINLHLINKFLEFKSLLLNPIGGFLITVGVSQIISNVPASLLLAPFIFNPQIIVWGVNVGGLGTLIASMASLISYRLFIRVYPQLTSEFLICFCKYNLIGLLVYCAILIPILLFMANYAIF